MLYNAFQIGEIPPPQKKVHIPVGASVPLCNTWLIWFRILNRCSRFCTAYGRRSPAPHYTFPPQNCPFARGIQITINTWFLGPTQVHIPNSISIGSAVLQAYNRNRQTDRTYHSVSNYSRPHLAGSATRPKTDN